MTGVQTCALPIYGVDITPGVLVDGGGANATMPSPVTAGIAEAYRFCPHELGLGRRVVMAKIKLLDQTLDASAQGIWFDDGELVTLLESLQKRSGGIVSALCNFLRQQSLHGELAKAVNSRIELIRKRDVIHGELTQARATGNLVREQELAASYGQLNEEIRVVQDITPVFLKS